ncbi:fimbria/pilus outer membrane usher protein [Tenebrionicola larvae]|nr:fimbria/pilus outer membrane usher protein [Tenebrionicola larvae]
MPAMLSGNDGAVADLSLLSHAGAQLPGVYDVRIYDNGEEITQRSVRFIPIPGNGNNKKGNNTTDTDNFRADKSEVHDKTGLIACLTVNDLIEFGVNTSLYPALSSLPGATKVSPGHIIAGAYTAFDFAKMRLDISIPQAALLHRPRGWIPPERWDNGINALMVGYQFNGSDNHGRYGDSRTNYLNLDSRLNLGPWRLRDTRSLSAYTNKYNSSHRWERLNTYAERSIIALKSQLTLGEANTPADVFDSVSFRGVKLASDEEMYPDSMHGYAPVIRGTAGSNARVVIRQNGSQIYQTFVPAGAFVINDLYALSAGGDLDVSVIEADGTTHVFTVPYSSVPVLRREGTLRYSVAGGRFRSNSSQYNNPGFVTGNLLWGLPADVTAYGGVQYAGRYQALALGLGLNMGDWGAISADITHAKSQLADDSKHQGQSVRFLYARSLNELGTTFQLTGYRYSTRGFHTLSETAMKGMEGWLYDEVDVDAQGRPIARPYTDYYNLYNTRRARLQANVTQRLGDLGSLYLSASRQTYWNRGGSSDYLTVGFSSSVGAVSYSLSYSYNRDSGRDADKTGYVNVSVPFSALLPGDSSLSSSWAHFSSRRDSNGDLTHQVGMSGNLLEQRNLSWSLSQGYMEHSGYSGDAGLEYRGGYGSASVGYSYADGSYRQLNYGVNGGVYIHRNGLTLGEMPGETNVLIAAPGASDVPVENGSGVRTDWRGYAVSPLGQPYRESQVSLDVTHLDSHTELDSSTVRLVPTRGALVRASFRAHTGERALITLKFHGRPVPFGTMVTTDDGTGIVGDDGQVFLAGLKPHGHIEAQWGKQADQHCALDYNLPKPGDDVSVIRDTEICM